MFLFAILPLTMAIPRVSMVSMVLKFQGDILRETLVKHCINQSALSRKLGVSREAVSQWVNGKSQPNNGHVLDMLLTLGYTQDEARMKFWDFYK
jgi:transcriptional regulator with XRE-family HTH domain